MIKITKFYADWCPPCVKYSPIFEEAVKDKDYEVQNVDVDKNLELVAKNKVGVLPLTIVEGPKGSKRRTGILTPDTIQELVNSVS